MIKLLILFFILRFVEVCMLYFIYATCFHIHDCLPDAQVIYSSEVDDTYLWKPGNRAASSSFSTKRTLGRRCIRKESQCFGILRSGFKV